MEIAFLLWLQGFSTPFFNRFMVLVTSLGNGGWLWILLCLVLLWRKNTRLTGWAMAIALVLGLIITNLLLKNLVARLRPYEVYPSVQLLITRPKDFSFPSGHATSAFAAATVLLRTRSKLRWPALVLACLIAFSRLYLFVHYPSDVLAGIGIGIAAGHLGYWLVFRSTLRSAWLHKSHKKQDG